MVKPVVTGLPLNHYLTQSDEVRNTSIEGSLMKMYDHDFVEPQLQHCANKLCILINCQGMVDGHYELPLPLKDEGIRLTNNRAAAMKRLESFRRSSKRMIESSKNTRILWKN